MAFWAARGLKRSSSRFPPFLIWVLTCIALDSAHRQLADFHRIVFTHAVVLSAAEKRQQEKGIVPWIWIAELTLTGTFVSPAEPPGRVGNTTNNPFIAFFLFLTKVLPLACG